MFKKHVKKLSFFSIILCHLGFLAAILFENQNNIFVSIFIVMSLVLLVVTYKKTPLNSVDYSFEHVLIVAFVFFGAIITYVLSSSFGLNRVLSASLVGLIASFIPNLFKRSMFAQGVPAAVYCGAFVGMTNISVSTDYIIITIASATAGLLLVGTKDTFHGVGGKLGTLAFAGVVFAFLITSLISQWV